MTSYAKLGAYICRRLAEGADPYTLRKELHLTKTQMRELAHMHSPETARALMRSRAWTDDSMRGKAPIDHEIERILRRPSTEKADCPSCWRCRWYDGLRPVKWKAPTLADPEIRAAVENVEREKIRIAGGENLLEELTHDSAGNEDSSGAEC